MGTGRKRRGPPLAPREPRRCAGAWLPESHRNVGVTVPCPMCSQPVVLVEPPQDRRRDPGPESRSARVPKHYSISVLIRRVWPLNELAVTPSTSVQCWNRAATWIRAHRRFPVLGRISAPCGCWLVGPMTLIVRSSPSTERTQPKTGIFAPPILQTVSIHEACVMTSPGQRR